ncbi:MAG: hypothetical protein E6626_09585 [Flavonifractor plautii]|nr:hypothetical protein [Flavonifractor plautii]MDU6289789.1 hypothetical protein [Flavonifractor plautii]MDU6342370.1 hypothetical protein [Flavonifractor plautii]
MGGKEIIIPAEFEGVFQGIELTEREIGFLTWMAGWDRYTIDNLKSLFRKVRAKAIGDVIQPSNEPLPIFVLDEPDREYIDYICPGCKEIISQQRRGQRMNTVYQCKYHDRCGQRVDWSKPQPYRRPPEGEV